MSAPHPSSTEPDLDRLQTEARNDATRDIDVVSTLEMCRLINAQDLTVPHAVARHLPTIARIIDELVPRVRAGGRVVYVGAGTSGRLGVLDSSEIPPTFSAPPNQFIGLIAGGDPALRLPIEGAEDSASLGASALSSAPYFSGPGGRPLSATDSVLGLAASGRTPWVLGALAEARAQGCYTAGICCVAPSEMRDVAADVVECEVGPEAVTGSTRMKSGTAQKLILNMISTGVQIRLGKTYGNLMVDVARSNHKLVLRSRRIFRHVLSSLSELGTVPPADHPAGSASASTSGTSLGSEQRADWTDSAIDDLIDACDGSVKRAALVAALGCTPAEAKARLERAGGVLKVAVAGGADGAA